MTIRTLAAFALAALLGIGAWATSAGAYNCQTTCNTYGNQRVCNTNCY